MAATAGYDMFSVRFSRDDGTVVLHVTGELDVAAAPDMRHALTSLIDDQGSLSVRVDLAKMTFIDSVGLSVLLEALRRLRDKGGELSLANPEPGALRVFDMVGFTRIFDIGPRSMAS